MVVLAFFFFDFFWVRDLFWIGADEDRRAKIIWKTCKHPLRTIITCSWMQNYRQRRIHGR
jgi:hypothetical protein